MYYVLKPPVVSRETREIRSGSLPDNVKKTYIVCLSSRVQYLML